MWLFDWVKRRSSKPLYPEALWTVRSDGHSIQVTDRDQNMTFVSSDDLTGIAVETNDTGPWGADVWWHLFGKDGKRACSFPQGATGEKEVLDQFMALPGFDNHELVRAMGSTSNAIFPVWRRNG